MYTWIFYCLHKIMKLFEYVEKKILSISVCTLNFFDWNFKSYDRFTKIGNVPVKKFKSLWFFWQKLLEISQYYSKKLSEALCLANWRIFSYIQQVLITKTKKIWKKSK